MEKKTDKHIKPGEKKGHLKVLYRGRRGKSYFYHCQCDCGSFTDVDATQLEQGHQTSCLCKGQYLEIGKKYDRLTVRRRIKRGVYECDCECGKTNVIVRTSDVLRGMRSCGCAGRPYNRKVRKNSSTGIRGVTFNKSTNRYSAYIFHDGKNKYLGSFKELEEARKAREDAEKALWTQSKEKEGE